MNCVTHHEACECREAENAEIKKRLAAQIDRLNLQNDELRKALWKRVRVWNDPERDYMLCDLCSKPEVEGHAPSCILYTEKRVDEKPQCTECLQRSDDVRLYCHDCFMT